MSLPRVTLTVCMEEKVVGLVADVKKWRHAEKTASKRATKAEEQVTRAEEATRRDKGEVSSLRFEHSRYLQKMLSAALDQAQKQAVADYQSSE